MLHFTVTSSGVLNEREIRTVIEREFHRAMTEIVLFGESEIAKNTPVGVTGHARQGVIGKVLSPFLGIIGFHGSAAKYGRFVEHGRKRGKFPPFAAIELWVKRTEEGKRLIAWVKRTYKIKNNAQALKQATFLKARAIARRGTRGAFMFKKAVPKVKQHAQTIFEAALKRIERALA
jgi:hypothetical protein